MTIKAYPYVRYSSESQKHNDSVRRQKAMIKAFVQKYALELDESLELNDHGTSAYRGDNIESGDLGKFISLVEARKIERGSFLLIENFDRFSRMQVRSALMPFLKLIEAGINIVTLEDEKVYDTELGALEMMGTIISMERAHEESARKGRLVAASKKQAKQDIIDGKRSTLWKWGTPKWLNLSLDRTEYTKIDDRVVLIKRILKWVVDGYGIGSIVKKIEAEGIKPWSSSSGIKSKNRKPKCWYNSQILRIVKSRALIGELELKQKDTNGNPIPSVFVENYFPKIIDEDYFYRIQNALQSRLVAGTKPGGRKGKTFSNLFSKLLVCGYSLSKRKGNGNKSDCSGENQLFVYSNNDKKDRKSGKKWRQRYLKCAYAKENAARCVKCRKSIRYDFFEKAFLTHVKDIPIDEIFGVEDEEEDRKNIVGKIESLEGKLADANKWLESYNKYIEKYGVTSKTSEKQALEKEQIIEMLPDQLRQLEIELKGYDEKATKKTFFEKDLRLLLVEQEKCKSEQELYELRERISILLKEIINRIELYPMGLSKSSSRYCHSIIRYKSGSFRHLVLDTMQSPEEAKFITTMVDVNSSDNSEIWVKKEEK